ncbi:hypothetical protein COOONC_05869 [Cooperia oncophora]
MIPNRGLDPETTEWEIIFIIRRLCREKRRDQLGAIESIVNIEESKRRRYVEEVVKNVKDILKENRETLERIGHAASEPYPHDSETLTNAISKSNLFNPWEIVVHSTYMGGYPWFGQ